ncbi:MAG: radical SAM protein [Chloroflexota bacterium]
MESPEYVQTSLAAAITLGLIPGRFRRDAKLSGLNLLLTYVDGCTGRCAYCGLAQGRELPPKAERTFIRVRWPAYPLAELIERAKGLGGQLRRVCVSMITHRRAFADMNTVVRALRVELPLPISVLISPTMLPKPRPMLAEARASGADMANIAVDAATEALFNRYRQDGVGGPHRWKHFWETVEAAAEVFGRHRAGVHLIVGLGETEEEMIGAIQRAHDLGAHTHLFSFFPEPGTALAAWPQPSYGQYRRVQLARYLINQSLARAERMAFNRAGQVVNFGVGEADETIAEGTAFMTSGCPGEDGQVACNRPFGNERPSQPLRNYPFPPEVEDIALIRCQLREGLAE